MLTDGLIARTKGEKICLTHKKRTPTDMHLRNTPIPRPARKRGTYRRQEVGKGGKKRDNIKPFVILDQRRFQHSKPRFSLQPATSGEHEKGHLITKGRKKKRKRKKTFSGVRRGGLWGLMNMEKKKGRRRRRS